MIPVRVKFRRKRCIMLQIREKAGIPEAEETVLLAHRHLIRAKHVLTLRKGRNQHDEGRFRQMEVGDQRIHALKLIARIDEDIGPAGGRRHGAIRKCCGLDGTTAGGAGTDDTMALCVGAIDLIRFRLLDDVVLAVHVVFLDLVRLDRTEGAEADMQGDVGDLHALLLHGLEQLLGPVETGGRGRRRAVVLCIDGIVACLFLQLMMDVRWDRHLAEAVEHLLPDTLELETDDAVAIIDRVDDLALQQALAELDARTVPELLSRLDEALPVGRAQAAKKQYLDMCASTRLLAMQACRDDLRIVDDEAVTLMKIVDDVIKMTVIDLACEAVHHQKPAV